MPRSSARMKTTFGGCADVAPNVMHPHMKARTARRNKALIGSSLDRRENSFSHQLRTFGVWMNVVGKKFLLVRQRAMQVDHCELFLRGDFPDRRNHFVCNRL